MLAHIVHQAPDGEPGRVAKGAADGARGGDHGVEGRLLHSESREE